MLVPDRLAQLDSDVLGHSDVLGRPRLISFGTGSSDCAEGSAVRYVVLDSKPQNQYGDTPEEYTFPRRYLSLLDSASPADPVFAIVYEPRGQNRAELGRMAYVGWAVLSARPEAIPDHTKKWYRVRYSVPFHPFDHPVARRIGDRTVESRFLDGQENQIGNAVRTIPDAEVQLILQLAFAGRLTPDVEYPMAGETPAEPFARDRVEKLVTSVRRDASFRDGVLSAFDGRCVVTGFEVGSSLPRRTYGLLDAAHIMPVANNGPDELANGLALTPTLHRLFDAGLFTFIPARQGLRVLASQHLSRDMVTSKDGSSRLNLTGDSAIALPAILDQHRALDYLEFHRRTVFQR